MMDNEDDNEMKVPLEPCNVLMSTPIKQISKSIGDDDYLDLFPVSPYQLDTWHTSISDQDLELSDEVKKILASNTRLCTEIEEKDCVKRTERFEIVVCDETPCETTNVSCDEFLIFDKECDIPVESKEICKTNDIDAKPLEIVLGIKRSLGIDELPSKRDLHDLLEFVTVEVSRKKRQINDIMSAL